MATHKANFQCIKCQQSFSTEYEIQLHVASHMLTEGTRHECRLCGAFFDSPGKLQTHLIQHSFLGSEIVCFVCDKTFESPQEIQVHALEHSSAYKKFACTICPQKFFFSAEFDNHKLIYGHEHSEAHMPKDKENSQLINCSLCLETFDSATAMQQHFFAVHSDSDSDHNKKKKLYKCIMCERECSTLSALQNHILSHRTGAR